jgi:L-asparaginase II
VTADDVELVHIVRNGVVESVHRGHVVVSDPRGGVIAALGDARRLTYVRSAVKPFQALATLDLLAAGGHELDDHSLAIACASHDGTDEQMIEAARVLAEADLDETALQCPPALPRDPTAAWAQRRPHPLAHNCSGKHAGFLAAMAAAGEDPATYLALDSAVQQQVVRRLAETCGAAPQGPGVDGCGAPAWLLPLAALATGFARLAGDASAPLARVRRAMCAHPELIGGPASVDTRLMQCDPQVVAKRGAEAVFATGVARGSSSLGIAVKITDGGTRADGPVAATVLASLGLSVPQQDRVPLIYGGGVVQGAVQPTPAVAALLGDLGPT